MKELRSCEMRRECDRHRLIVWEGDYGARSSAAGTVFGATSRPKCRANARFTAMLQEALSYGRSIEWLGPKR